MFEDSMYVFLPCFNLVKVELPLAGAAKCEMCAIIRLLHVEGQPAVCIHKQLTHFQLRNFFQVSRKCNIKHSEDKTLYLEKKFLHQKSDIKQSENIL